ncbi:MAG: thioredoxin family protein [Bacteroidetes bacterium]|nr:thioredoxin family protein [Bacteroidota bacterium]MBU1113958.1 thioredoxin family protein [Bacteroidota bacterium]MBU1800105.1 thioredoxin family protein [Bacteroidota bacterium]
MDVAITVGVIVLLMLSLKLFMQKRVQRVKGKSVNVSIFTSDIQELLKGKKSILYFYTPSCGACKTQSPIIDRLKDDIDFVGKIDLSDKREVATEFGILGTPTTAIMRGNNIEEIFVGLKKFDFLKAKFEVL